MGESAGAHGLCLPRVRQGVKHVGSSEPVALRGSHGNLVVLLWLGPLSLPAP